MTGIGDRAGSPRRRRHRVWLLALCGGLVVGQPAVALSQTLRSPVGVAQIGGAFGEPVCQLVRSLQVSFGAFPGVAGIFTSLLQALGCSTPPPGTTPPTTSPATTTTVVSATTTTAAPPPTTNTTLGSGPTSSTTSTTLPACLPPDPNVPIPTTVPCIPTTTTTMHMGGTTTTTAP